MLNSYVYPFGDDSISHLFVDNHSDWSWVHIEDTSSTSMIVFVGHAFVNSSVDYNINDISNFVGGKCFRDVDGSMLFESLFEFVSGSSLIAVAVSHDYK